MKRANVLIALLVVVSCQGEGDPTGMDPDGTQQRGIRLAVALAPDEKVPEEEVFGMVFEFGSRIDSSDGPYEARLTPLPGTSMPSGVARRMMVDPVGGSLQDWGWYDSLETNNRVDLADGRRVNICLDGPEVHRQLDAAGTPLSPSQTDKEVHCIGPGQYRVGIYDMGNDGRLIVQRDIDFLGIDKEGTNILVEVPDFARGFSVMDNIVHVDRKILEPWIDPILEPVQDGMAGETYFRFNASRTTTNWNEDTRGRISVRWIWNTADPLVQSLFTNNRDSSGELIRLHRYSSLLQPGIKTARAEFTTPYVGYSSGATQIERDSVSFFVASATQLCLQVYVTTPCSSDGTCIPELSRTEIKVRWTCSDWMNLQNHRYVFGDGVVTPWITDSGDMIHDYQESGAYLFRATVQRVGSPGDTLSYTEVVTLEDESAVSSIGVTPSTATMQAGQSLLLTATPRDQNGNVVSGEAVSWSSSNSKVTVTPRGANPNKADVTSQVASTALITAAIGSVKGTSSVQFTVSSSCPVINEVQVAVSDGLINVGESTSLQAIPKDASGNTVSSSGCSIGWSSTPEVSVVQNSQYPYLATATGSSAGTATVTATVGNASGSNQITVGAPPAGDNARPYGVGNSFPPTMYQGQFYAVSVYMENTGGTTWSSPDYTLKKVAGTGFEPLTVQLSQNVPPGTNHPFSFNLYNEAVYGQGYDVQYQMRRAGNGTFGLRNGGWIDVLDPAGCTKNCDPTVLLQVSGQTYPGGAIEGDMRPAFGSNGWFEDGVVQSLVIEDYPLRFFPDNGSQVAYIRYFGALGEPWSVDVTFRLTFDPGSVQVGQVKKAIALSGYDLEVLSISSHELVVKLNRRSSADALPDESMKFLEIPLIAVQGKTPPSTLPVIELTVER